MIKFFELYYWDDGQWIFFETVREKEKTFLSFKNVAKGRLYMLRDLQRAQEKQATSERIFICEEGEVLWY